MSIWHARLSLLNSTEVKPDLNFMGLLQRAGSNVSNEQWCGAKSQLQHFSSSILLFPPPNSHRQPSSPLQSYLNMLKLNCSFCSKRFILFIVLLVSPSTPPPHTPLLFRQGCAVRPFQSAGVVRSDGWLSTFCCLPLSSWEIYRHADYQAWKPISLSHSFLPSSIHTCLAPSISLPQFQHHLRYKKKPQNFHNREMCAKQHWNLSVDRGKRLLLLRVIVDVSGGNSMFIMLRLVFESLSSPSLSSTLLPAPSKNCNTYIHPHSSCC